jgi:hypothetical protein
VGRSPTIGSYLTTIFERFTDALIADGWTE